MKPANENAPNPSTKVEPLLMTGISTPGVWEEMNLRADPEQPVYSFEDYQGQQVLRYAVARRMRQSCVDCHKAHALSPRRDWKVGDVRGVLEIIRPLDRAYSNQQPITILHGTLAPESAIVKLGLRGTARPSERPCPDCTTPLDRTPL